jgi:hypothetical protein
MCVYEDDLPVIDQHIHQFRRQLDQEDGIHLSAEFIHAGVVIAQCFLTQAPAQSIDYAKSDTVVSTVFVAEANNQGARGWFIQIFSKRTNTKG